VATDYYTVGKDLIVESNKKPFKALAYTLGLSGFLILYKTNPNTLNYRDTRMLYMSELIMCGSVKSERSEAYLDGLTRLDNMRRLQHKDCVFFSLIINADDTEHNLALYELKAEPFVNPGKYNVFNYLSKSLRFLSRIVDVGYLNRWHYLEKNFVDYDVDEREWTSNNK
jgi:hypothetical protein